MIGIYLFMLETDEERDKMTEIFTKYSQLYNNIAVSIVGNIPDVDDIVYEHFLKIIELKDDVFQKSEIAFKRWSIVVLQNSCKDFLRKKNRTPKTLDIDEYVDVIVDTSDISVEMKIENKEQCEQLSFFLEELSELNFEIVQMKYFHHLKLSEIAQKLDMTQEQVNSRLEYARKQIRKLFEEEGVCL